MNQGYNNPEILSMKELEKKYVEYIKEMQRICSIKDNAIVFDIGFEYEIELSRCDTPQKLLSWVYHLSEKTWMTRDIIHYFIRLAAQHHGIDIKIKA